MKNILILLVVGAMSSSYIGVAHSEESDMGIVIYDMHCMVCHGFDGKGRYLADPALKTDMPDFTDQEFKKSLTRERIVGSLVNGVETTHKSAIDMDVLVKTLSSEDLQAVAEYILERF